MSKSQEITLVACSNSSSDKPNGFRILKADRERLFERLKSHSSRMEVIIELPCGESLRFSRPETSLFWSTCPEFRSSKIIGTWIKNQADDSWSDSKPPKYIAKMLTTDDGAIKIKVLPKK